MFTAFLLPAAQTIGIVSQWTSYTKPGKFQPIALISCIEKVFTTIYVGKNQWLYMLQNDCKDKTVQRVFSSWTSLVAQSTNSRFKLARAVQKATPVNYLNLANVYGSFHHQLIQFTPIWAKYTTSTISMKAKKLSFFDEFLHDNFLFPSSQEQLSLHLSEWFNLWPCCKLYVLLAACVCTTKLSQGFSCKAVLNYISANSVRLGDVHQLVRLTENPWKLTCLKNLPSHR